MEGLWYTHFTTGQTKGDGLAVLRDGEVLGGDALHVYKGSYQADGSHLYVNLRVSPHESAEAPSDMQHPVNVFLKGSITGDSAMVTGHPDRHDEVKIAVELHKAL